MKKPFKSIQFRRATEVPKGWGKEVRIVNETVLDEEEFPTGYSGKLLVYDKAGAVSSMHFHTVKHETFYVLSGRFVFSFYNPENAEKVIIVLVGGDIVSIPTSNPHQISCEAPGTIIEFASTDYSWDNYRVEKGDSQRSSA